AATGKPCSLPSPARQRLDGRLAKPSPGRADVHVLGLLPRSLGAQRRIANRSLAAEPASSGAPGGGRRRPGGSRTREGERSRAGVVRAGGTRRSAARRMNGSTKRSNDSIPERIDT